MLLIFKQTFTWWKTVYLTWQTLVLLAFYFGPKTLVLLRNQCTINNDSPFIILQKLKYLFNEFSFFYKEMLKKIIRLFKLISYLIDSRYIDVIRISSISEIYNIYFIII
jgi:hypothetical protein